MYLFLNGVMQNDEHGKFKLAIVVTSSF